MSGANRELLLSQIGDLKDRLVEDADVLCQSVEGVIVTYSTLEYSKLMEKYDDSVSFLDLS